MRRMQKEVPADPLIRELQGIEPLDLEKTEQLLKEREVPFLRKRVETEQELAAEAVLVLSKRQRGMRRYLSMGALFLVAGIYVIDFIRNPAYPLALVLAVLAAGVGVFLLGGPKREAPKTAALYCQNVPSFALCLFEAGMVFEDGGGNVAVCPHGALVWCETERAFACLVNGRGLIYLPKAELDERETGLVKGLLASA